MSEWGDMIDAIETEVRQAAPDLPAGASGWERADGSAENLPTEDFPHVFLRSTLEATERAPDAYGAKDVTILVTFGICTLKETHEQVATRLDAIRDEITANPTLGGLVESAIVAARGIREHPQSEIRIGEFVVELEVAR